MDFAEPGQPYPPALQPVGCFGPLREVLPMHPAVGADNPVLLGEIAERSQPQRQFVLCHPRRHDGRRFAESDAPRQRRAHVAELGLPIVTGGADVPQPRRLGKPLGGQAANTLIAPAAQQQAVGIGQRRIHPRRTLVRCQVVPKVDGDALGKRVQHLGRRVAPVPVQRPRTKYHDNLGPSHSRLLLRQDKATV